MKLNYYDSTPTKTNHNNNQISDSALFTNNDITIDKSSVNLITNISNNDI